MERFLAEVTTQEWNAEQDAGRPWAEAVEVLAGRFHEGDHVVVDTKDRETFTFRREAAVPQPA